MGYKRPVKTFVLDFEDTDYAGLEIELRSMNLFDFLNLRKTFTSSDDEDHEAMYRLFAKHLKSWNLEEDDGTAIAATYENLVTLEVDFVLLCVKTWIDALAGTPSSDLGKDSPSGSNSLAESIPMDV